MPQSESAVVRENLFVAVSLKLEKRGEEKRREEEKEESGGTNKNN